MSRERGPVAAKATGGDRGVCRQPPHEDASEGTGKGQMNGSSDFGAMAGAA